MATAATATTKGRPAKKPVKKNIYTGIVHIQSTFNNTIVTITDVNGAVISWASAGSRGFKGSRKSTPFAAQLAAEEAGRRAMEHGVRSVAVRNEGYWRDGPWLDQIEFFGLADESARVNALLSGDVQLASTINPRSVKQLQDTGAFGILDTRAGNYTNLIMRLDAAPGSSPDFVLGMKSLINREQIRSAIYRGYAEIANDHPIPSSNRFYAKDIPQRPFDPDQAKFHFQKAGVLGTTIPVIASPAADDSVEMAVLLQQEAQKIGLTLDVQRVPSDGFWSNYWMKSPVGFGNINPRPTADLLLTLFYKSDAPWNESGWKDGKFDQLLVAARAETDEDKRRQMYHDLQVMVRDGSGVAIPTFISNLDAYTSTLKGLKPMPTGALMGYGFGEYVWLDS